ncbi:MAG: SDR family oxidoreductase [Cyanobacteria bacterium HKST-UBA02]|nr:SDR family oxidoreductase [Cyanobacteria bacterium HKST-UBA02]
MNRHDWLASNYDFKDEVAVITGGAGGLGIVMVEALLAMGAKVAVLARTPAKAAGLAKSDRLLVLESDVLDSSALEKNRERINSELGEATVLINVAGGNFPGAVTTAEQSFFDLKPAEIQRVLSLNLEGTIIPCQVFGRDMAERGRGCIVNISSMAADRPLTSVPAYSASKAAIDNFTAWLAVRMAMEYGAGIRVNAIAPGFFITELNRYLLTDRETGDYSPRGKKVVAHTPMGRMGEPDELVGALLFLVSPSARFVTGTVIPVDGGFSAYAGV